MAKTKQVKKEDIAAAPKQSPMILSNYKPIPKYGSGCSGCK